MMPPNEPLSNQERDLARQLHRVGPQGGPSPELDARILAAARAAVAMPVPRPTRPRWPVAFGVAASMVVAVGIAWQMRPLDEVPMITSEAPAQAVPAQSAVAPDDAAEAVPAAPSAESEDALSSADSTGPRADDPGRTAEAEAGAEADDRAGGDRSAPSSAGQARPAARSPSQSREAAAQKALSAPQARHDDEPPLRAHDRFVPPAPLAPPAAAAAAATAADDEPGEALRSVGDAQGDADRQSRAFLPDRPLHGAPADARRSDPRQFHPRIQAPRTVVDSSAADAGAETSETLDRVEVSGSRVRRTDLQVPVAEDVLLDQKAWIERIRTRQGIGDEAAARRSLELFVQAHSRASVPADLIHLLAD